MKQHPFSFWEWDSFSRADVVIVGAGVTGFSAALDWKATRPQDTVVILEKGVLPSGATGRNAGFACFGSPTEVLGDLDLLGETEAMAIVQSRWEGLKRLRERLRGSEGIFEDCGGHEVIGVEQEFALEHLGRLNALMGPILGTRDVYNIQEKEKFGFGTSVKAVVKMPLEGAVHSGRLLAALWAQAEAAGVKVMTGAAVEGVEGGKTPLVHVRGLGFPLQAGCVLLCTSARLGELAPATGVVPARGQILVTEEIPELAWKGTFHMDFGYVYFRHLGQRILLGGCRNLAFEAEATCSLDTTTEIQTALEKILKEIILPSRDMPKIEMRWAGSMGFSPDKKPIVRETAKGVWAALSCNGMGVALASQVAHRLVRAAQ